MPPKLCTQQITFIVKRLWTTIGFCKKVKLEVFQAWLEALIACIGSGRIVQVPDKESTRLGKVIELSFLRLLHPLIHRFDTLSLVSRSSNWHQCSLSFSDIQPNVKRRNKSNHVHNQQYCVRVSLLLCRQNLPPVDNLCQNNSKSQNGEGSILFSRSKRVM